MAEVLGKRAHDEWHIFRRPQDCCRPWHTAAVPPFQSIAAYAPPGVGMLAVGVVCEVFAPRGSGFPRFDFALCADRPGRLATDSNVPLTVEHGLDRFASADLLIALPGAARADTVTFTGPPIAINDVMRSSTKVPASGRFEWHVNPSTRPAVAGQLPGRRRPAPGGW